MTVKEYLRQIHCIEYKIRLIESEITEMRANLTAIGGAPEGERVQTSKTGDTMPDRLSRVIEKEEKRKRLLIEYTETREKIIDQILSMTDRRHVELLYKRYVENKRLEQIACECNYSYTHIKRMHGQALQEFAKIVDAEVSKKKYSYQMSPKDML